MVEKNEMDKTLEKYFKWIKENVSDKGFIAGDLITADALLREFPEIERPQENRRWYASQIVRLYNKKATEVA